MSNLNETCAGVVVVFSVTTLAFTAFHTYKFDGCRCLIPRKKEWFRILLTWMLIGCNIGILIWGAGWAWVKFDLGWFTYPDPYGSLPVQPEQFPQKYRNLQVPLTTAMNLGYSLQMSLNAEEGLYWWHLMRAVRQPRSAKSWLNSYYFFAWIVISIVCTALQCSIGWINTNGDPNREIAQELLCGGILEAVVLAAASIVLIKFPAFLEDVKASGAGPDVRSRLHFYHEANKARSFFRFIFTVTLLILGADGVGNQLVNQTPIASDIIIQMCIGAFNVILMISMMLYLPRSYNTAPRAGQIMIAPQQPHLAAPNQLTSGNALMSLLREGGQWDDDDDLRANATQHDGLAFEVPKTWSMGSKLNDEQWSEARPPLPSALQDFTSPIAVPVGSRPLGPLEIRIEREVHRDV